MFKEHSGAFVTRNTRSFEIQCNQYDKEEFIKQLSKGESFYIDLESDADCDITFSIENAVKLRDYLNDMIQVVKDSGYFIPQEEKGSNKIETKLGNKNE